MGRSLQFLLLSMLITMQVNARQVTNGIVRPPKDTSFTIYSAFVKEKKQYPFIKIAKATVSGDFISGNDRVYSSINGRDLHADIFFPMGSQKNRPVVLLVHGGGWKSGDKSQMTAIAEMLAANAIWAIQVEYRLSPEAKFPAALYDLKAAVRWIRSIAGKYGMNKEKIAVLGVSAGGQLAALLGATNGMKDFEGTGGNTEQSSTVQAVIDIDGILAFKHPESAEGKVAAEWLGGTYEENPSAWQTASALTHAGKQMPPTLFINSQYVRFHAGRDDLINKLKPYSIYTEIKTIPETPHTFWLFDPWFEPVMKYVVAFLNNPEFRSVD